MDTEYDFRLLSKNGTSGKKSILKTPEIVIKPNVNRLYVPIIPNSDFSQGKRGAIEATGKGKTRITIRLDDEILVWFRKQVHLAGGGNYQTLINNALREYVQQRREPLEEILRRVVREELSQINMRVNE
jgi:uncharacterized protein (DUF4415 family)